MTFVLLLNDMRASKIEITEAVARAETAEELNALIEREKVPAYITDGHWGKSFRQGGPLEWYNPPYASDRYIVDAGTRSERVSAAAADAERWWDRNVECLPHASDITSPTHAAVQATTDPDGEKEGT